MVRAKQKLLQLTVTDNKTLSVNTPGLQSNMAPVLYLREAENKPKKPTTKQYIQKTNPNNQPKTSIRPNLQVEIPMKHIIVKHPNY